MNQGNSKDKSVTVRFSSTLMDVIDELAKEYKITRSDIIRLATDNALERYLDHVRYIDQEQAREISCAITSLGNTMSETLYNLRRIGYNFDQLLRKVNAGEIHDLQDRDELIRREELNQLVSRLEHVAKKVGEDIHVFKN